MPLLMWGCLLLHCKSLIESLQTLLTLLFLRERIYTCTVVQILDYGKSRILIWSEAVGVAPVIRPSLHSYLAHHQIPMNVFVYEEEVENLSNFMGPNSTITIVGLESLAHIGFSTEAEYRTLFKYGHLGTARLWSEIVFAYPEVDYFIHLDSDNIYVDSLVDDILQALDEHYFVGFRRPYFQHSGRLPHARRLRYWFSNDKVHTFAFGFSKKVAENHSRQTFEDAIRGASRGKVYRLLNPVLDFFDQVVQLADPEGSKTFFLGESKESPRKRGKPSDEVVNHKVLNFSAVGSGYNFWKSGWESVPETYVNYAMAQFSVYNKYFLGYEVGDPEQPKEPLRSQLQRLDTSRWVLMPVDSRAERTNTQSGESSE